MRLALIADIHGNLVALEAALADIKRRQVDQIVCLGDLALRGPQPREVVARVRALNVPVVRGNAEDQTFDYLASGPESTGAGIDAMERWAAHLLPDDDLAWFSTLPATLIVPLSVDSTLLACHGSPRSNTDNLLVTTPAEMLDEWFADTDALVVAAAHTHESLVRRHRDLTIVNPGSTGTLYDRTTLGDTWRVLLFAEYTVVDYAAGNLSIELHRVPLDRDAQFAAAEASGMPQADVWIEQRGD